MLLKDAHVMRVEEMVFESRLDKQGQERLEVQYFDADGEVLKESFYLSSQENCRAFYFNFIRMHLRLPGQILFINSVEDAIRSQNLFRAPLFVIARKQKHYWMIREKIWNN
jgi:DNA repair protein RadD